MNGALIAKRMVEQGLNDTRLAADSNCSIGTIMKLKRGEAVRLATVLKVAEILGIDLKDIVAKRTSYVPRKSSVAS